MRSVSRSIPARRKRLSHINISTTTQYKQWFIGKAPSKTDITSQGRTLEGGGGGGGGGGGEEAVAPLRF